MSKLLDSDKITITFTTDFSILPVSTREVQLIRSYFDEVLMKVLQQEEEE